MMAIDPNITLLAVAVANAATAYFAWRAKIVATETKEIALQTEKNTNSMKDALVLKVGEAAHAAGLEQGRVAGEAKAAVLAEGNRQGATK